MAAEYQIHKYDQGGGRRLVGSGREQPRMLLVPFDCAQPPPSLFDSALERAREASAELVLLCVRSPHQSMWYAQEGEQVFADLRGLQARLSDPAVPIRFESVSGPIAQFVLDYTSQYNVDMIMIPGYPVGAKQQPTG